MKHSFVSGETIRIMNPAKKEAVAAKVAFLHEKNDMFWTAHRGRRWQTCSSSRSMLVFATSTPMVRLLHVRIRADRVRICVMIIPPFKLREPLSTETGLVALDCTISLPLHIV